MEAIVRFTVFALTLLVCTLAHAQIGYPVKTLRLVNGFPAGGPSDIFARAIAQKLTDVIGQQVIVDSRPGGNAWIAAEYVAKLAPPDGYTFFLTPCSVFAIHPHLYAKMPVELKDFAPVTIAVTVPEMLVVHPSLPVKTAKELATLAKAKPGQLTYGSAGTGGITSLAVESFKIAAGVNILHVPYKGAAPAVVDLLGGHVQLVILDMPVLLPHVKSSKLRALAVATGTRVLTLPDVPTMSEAGYPAVNADNWYGVVVAAATPKDIVAKLHAALVKTLQTPETRERLAAQGAEAVSSTPEQFAAFIQAERVKWGKVIKAAGVTLD
jgi:tripartite-type tricarboxylate transporter receptor subunit TctC